MLTLVVESIHEEELKQELEQEEEEEAFEGDEDDYVALDNEDEEWRRFTIDFAFYFAFLSLSEDLNFKHSIVLLLVSTTIFYLEYYISKILHLMLCIIFSCIYLFTYRLP